MGSTGSTADRSHIKLREHRRLPTRMSAAEKLRRLVRPLALIVLITCCGGMTSSCSILGPILGIPLKVAGSVLKTVTTNPVGAAAGAAAVF